VFPFYRSLPALHSTWLELVFPDLMTETDDQILWQEQQTHLWKKKKACYKKEKENQASHEQT